MKFSLNWLREFVELPEKTEQLGDLLTLAGVEIESILPRGVRVDKVIVGQITASAPHPNADRLSVCQVDDGSGMNLQIVCGATNYKTGDKVPVALPGAVLPNGTRIRESKLRGVDSEGMLCSAMELGIGEDASGLLILSPDAPIGTPIGALYPEDTILDVEITPNRGDLLSHYGLAREIAALTGKSPPSLPGHLGEMSGPQTVGGPAITATGECPFFSARRIENIRVGPSPAWLRARIESLGVRSINNVVDVSNLVMLELGQPTHAFDADKLNGNIEVRLARPDEKFLALDGKTYSLGSHDLVIADSERAVGIGGVMGGEQTAVSESTRNVLLEAAWFLPAAIRRTARDLNLPTDASYRFERGVDPALVLAASQRAAELMREIAGGAPASEISVAGKLPPNPADVSLRYQRCNQLLGITIEPKKIDGMLERFGLDTGGETSDSPGGATTWKIPSYRRDLQREVDLIEEVVRAHGVDRIEGTDRSRFTPSSQADAAHDRESRLREDLRALGLHEARTSKLIPRQTSLFSASAIELRNPLSQDHVALRPGLIEGLLHVVERNLHAGSHRITLFELGRVFLPPSGQEQRRLGLVMTGTAQSQLHWRSDSKRKLDFMDLKGIIDAITERPLAFQSAHRDDLSLATEIFSGNDLVGFAGQLSAARAGQLDATAPILLAELNLDLLPARPRSRSFEEMDRFPAVRRDVALIVPEKVTHSEIVKVIEKGDEPLLQGVELFDLFTGSESAAIGAGRKSLAYTLTYRNKNRTLTGEEVTAAHARIRERLQSELGAELREQVL